jgi:hypothetical protein
MLRSRMFTPGFRIYFGFFAFLLAGAFIFGVSSELQVPGSTVRQQLDTQGLISVVLGPLTVGWKGAVGNHLGYAVLLGGALIAALLSFVLVAFRDADPESLAEVLEVETVPLTRAPSGTNFAPMVGAFAATLIGLGWVISNILFYSGIALLLMVAAVWTLRAWADRATGDDQINHEIYVRFIDPLRVPVLAALLVGFVVFGLSRLLLAVPNKTASSFIFGAAAVLFFLGIIAVYVAPPNIRKALTVTLVVLAAIGVLAVGIYGVAKGERPIEHHGEPAGAEPGGSGGESGGSGSEHGLAPIGGTWR